MILNNSPIHKSNKLMAKIEEWKEKDVFIFFTSIFSRIESDWKEYYGEKSSLSGYRSMHTSVFKISKIVCIE